MMNFNCEDYEKHFPDSTGDQKPAGTGEALEKHRESCPSCQVFNQETAQIRTLLLSLPKLEAAPNFSYNLRREINRMEGSKSRPEWGTAPLPLALSGGFALAVLLGFLLFRPMIQTESMLPMPMNASQNVVAQDQPGETAKEVASAPVEQAYVMPADNQLLTEKAGMDTSIHQLPGEPGMEAIPVPVQTEPWPINQVSTTP